MEFCFSGKKFLVTGGANGLGRETSIALYKAGAEVYALDVDNKELETLKQQCSEERFHTLQADLTDWEATAVALEDVPVLDGLVNNAAILGDICSPLDVKKGTLKSTFDVNLFGAINVSQLVSKKMISAGTKGSIVNVSSIGGVKVEKYLVAYCMTKSALNTLTKHLAVELGPKGIRVNSISPTGINTGVSIRFRQQFPEAEQRLIDATPLGRLAEVEDIVGPIMYLLSDLSGMVTGSNHIVDGAYLN